MTELEQALSAALKKQSEEHSQQQQALFKMQRELLSAFETASQDYAQTKMECQDLQAQVKNLTAQVSTLRQQAERLTELLQN